MFLGVDRRQDKRINSGLSKEQEHTADVMLGER